MRAGAILALFLVAAGCGNGDKAAIKEIVVEQESKWYERRLTKETRYALDGRVTTSTRHSYSGERNGSLVYKEVSTYDHEGRKTGWRRLGPDGVVTGRMVKIRDAKGRDVETVWYDAEGLVTRRDQRRYQGARLAEVQKYKSWRLLRRIKKRYRPDGTLHEEREYDGGDVLTAVRIYGVKGKLIKWTSYDKGRLKGTSHYEYDDGGRILAEISNDAKGRPDIRYRRTYNEHGDLVLLIEEYVRAGRQHKSEKAHTYDRHGNWTKRVDTNDGVESRTTFRTITYYE